MRAAARSSPGDAESGGKPVRGRRPGADHGRIEEPVGRFPRCADRRCGGTARTARRWCRSRRTPPWRPLRGRRFAPSLLLACALRMPTRQSRPSGWRPSALISQEIDEGGRVALVAQEGRPGGIGDVALGETVQGHRHAVARKGDAGGADLDGAEKSTEVARDLSRALGENVVLDRGYATRNAPRRGATAVAPKYRTRLRSAPRSGRLSSINPRSSGDGFAKMPAALSLEISLSARARLKMRS